MRINSQYLTLSLAAALVLGVAAPASAAPASAVSASAVDHGNVAGAPKTIRLGKLTLTRCAQGPLTYCGGRQVPLDYSKKTSPDIHLGFVWLPAIQRNHAKGTVLAVEGGPGFATTGTEPEYLAMLGSLRQTRNLLLINLRGTGNSTPLNCPGLEHYGPVQQQSGKAFNKLVAGCGSKLNHTWRYSHGGFVHASDLFNTANSARDVSGILAAMRLGRIDLYGDSYGSWFAQVFASRYAAQLRSVTLDSTYQVLGLDPWYTTTVITARQAFTQACERSRACQSAAGGKGAWARIGKLAARLASKPVTGPTVSPEGTVTRLTVTVNTLVNLINNAGFDTVVYQDLDAAARALLQHHDQAPLLRLAALSLGFDNTNFGLPEFSDGLYFAVACTDYVQLFGRSAAPAVRGQQFAKSVRREPPRTFAPFTVSQWIGLDQYTEAYSGCLGWPTPVHHLPPITRKPPLVPSRVHVLILSGTFDSLTPWLDGATLVASQVGKSARVVRVANLTHVTLQDGNDSCPASIFQRFVADPGGLARQDTACASRVAPVHTVGAYPLSLAQAAPATPAKGNTASREALAEASTALSSVGDEISRWPLLDGITDLGLRGGKVAFSGGNLLSIKLTGTRWVANATINGTATWNQRTNFVTAHLTVTATGSKPLRLTASWRVYASQDQPAVITGSQGSRHLAAVTPAP